jgi:hypothetical protein
MRGNKFQVPKSNKVRPDSRIGLKSTAYHAVQVADLKR